MKHTYTHALTHFRNYSETAYKPVDTEMSYMATSKFIKEQ